MKILELIYSLSSGGGERFVVDLSNELAQRGNDVTICMLLNDQESRLVFNRQFIAKNVKFHAMKFSSGFSLIKIKSVEDYILKEMPDIVHCHLNVIPYVFRLAYCHREIKFFHTLHSIASKATGSKYQYYINKYFYSHNIIRPITISNECQLSYNRFYKLNNAPCIDNGRAQVIPSDNINMVKEEVSSYKAATTTPVFVHVARCHPSKNQDLLIDSFNELNIKGYDYVLLVIGTGYDTKDGQKLKEKACGKIYFLGEKNNVNDYLLCSDAFCLTSFYEGLPISLLEALSCGVTPICTSVGGIPDVISDGETGYLAEVEVESYLKAIQRFYARKISKNKLIKYFTDNFSIEVCSAKYLNQFNK